MGIGIGNVIALGMMPTGFFDNDLVWIGLT